jgi:hypothetical protein
MFPGLLGLGFFFRGRSQSGAAALSLTVLNLILAAPSIWAFPPAPFKTLHGMVRDEYGNALRLDGASVVFSKNGQQVLRVPIQAGTLLNQNYQIRLRMDMQRPGTIKYNDLAQNPGEQFTLSVRINDIIYQPIEMSTPATVGNPGERSRLDLTLGVDSDGDGIPDAWKISQLYAAGIMPDENGWRLDLLTRDGDFDGDGISNYAEYIAGTYATDANDYLSLKLVEKQQSSVRLSFYSIIGKTYSLEVSSDLKNWVQVSHYTRNPEPPEEEEPAAEEEEPAEEVAPFTPPVSQIAYEATDTQAVEIFSDIREGGQIYYRLNVR